MNLTFLNSLINQGKRSAIGKRTMLAEGEISLHRYWFHFGTGPVVEIMETFMLNPDCGFIYWNRSCDYLKKLPLRRKMILKPLQFFNWIFLSAEISDTQAGIPVKDCPNIVIGKPINRHSNLTLLVGIE